MAAEASGYEEDARRIERDYVDPSSTSPSEIEADLEANDFANPDEVAEWILSDEDVGGPALDPHSDGITTREEIARAVGEADEVGYTGSRQEAVTSSIASDVGAPSESALQRAQLQALTGETVTPEGGSTQVSIVSNTEGEPVAAVGGGSSAGPQVAEERGLRHYSSPTEFNESMTAQPAPDGSRALLYANGDAVGEVGLE